VATDVAPPRVCNVAPPTGDVAHVGRTLSGPDGTFINAQVMAFDPGAGEAAAEELDAAIDTCLTYYNGDYDKDVRVEKHRPRSTRSGVRVMAAQLTFSPVASRDVLLVVELRILQAGGLVETLLISRRPAGPPPAATLAIVRAAALRVAKAAA
jgi:hypothetical protein